jgi:hypothetical protein
MSNSRHHVREKARTRRWLLIVAAVVIAHAVFFAVAGNICPLPRVRYIPPPNFITAERAVVNEATGERTVYREFTVSTKLEKQP